jgi:hypothetical protein
MKREKSASPSPWSLRADLLSAKVLVWIAGVGRQVELTPEAELYFCDRYRRLAECYRARGRFRAAQRALAKAADYCGNDEPPFAAAMAMPRPRRFIVTDAVSRPHDGPDDAA